MNHELPDVQAGFRKGKGDALATALKFPSFSQNIVSSKEAIRCAKEAWRLRLDLENATRCRFWRETASALNP